MGNRSQNLCSRSLQQAGDFFAILTKHQVLRQKKLVLNSYHPENTANFQQYAARNNVKNIKSSYNFCIYLFIFTKFSLNFPSHYEQQLLLQKSNNLEHQIFSGGSFRPKPAQLLRLDKIKPTQTRKAICFQGSSCYPFKHNSLWTPIIY